ncbi:MAG: hypothetical protein ABR591_11945 [Candidatus Velthaea sp.]
MNRAQIFRFLLAAALIGVPCAAGAQSYPSFLAARENLAVLDRNECARIVREQDRDRGRDRASDYEREQRRLARECEREYGNGASGYGGYSARQRSARVSGIVSSFSPYNLYLQRGTHVELHRGTVINPTGIALRPGMRVSIIGNWNADGTFNANEIDARRYRGY